MPFFNTTPHVPGPPRPIATKVSEDHTNMKRKFEEMSGIVPPNKRVFDGSFRVPPTVPIATDALTETLFVPDHMVGLLIGAGGQHVMALQNETFTRIEVAANSMGKPRAVTITGGTDAIINVRARIQSLIDEHGGHADSDNIMTIDVIIPAAKAGLIIGTGGTTIKQLMAESNAKMYLIQESNHNNGIDKPLKITGTKEAVETAKRLVMDLINQGSGGAPPYIEITVPKAAVGMIIGNGGSTIKKLQEEYNVRVQFKPDLPNHDPETKICQILGEPDNYQSCAQKILEMISEMDLKKAPGISENNPYLQQYHAPIDSTPTQMKLDVPQSKAGLVIGKGGEVIKQLKMQSGANIELDRHAKPASANSDRIFKITGTPYQNAKAQHLIKQIIGEAPKHVAFPNEAEWHHQQSNRNNQSQMPPMGDPMQMAAYSGMQGWPGMPNPQMMMPSMMQQQQNPYDQWSQWMQSMQKSGPEYMNQYMDYMKKYMEHMAQQSGQSMSKDQIDSWMNYMKMMFTQGASGGQMQSPQSQPPMQQQSSQNPMEAMEQWTRYYQQMQQQQ
jgi:transcription antitermination factor NusA-like protein